MTPGSAASADDDAPTELDDALHPVEHAAIRAGRRPAAVLLMYGCQLAWGLVVASPVHAWARGVWGTHPGGDSVLWLPGGRELLAWLGDEGPAGVVVVRTTLVLLGGWLVLAQVPLAALLASLILGRGPRRRAPSTADALRRGLGAFVPLGTILVLFAILQLVTVFVFGAGGGALARALEARLGDARAFSVRLATTGLGIALALALGALADLARAAAMRAHVLTAPEAGALGIVLRALRAVLSLPSRAIRAALAAWALRGVAGLALVALGALAADALGGRDGAALGALWGAHQAIVLGRTALRASWLARASSLIAGAAAPAAEPDEAGPAQRASDL